MLKYKKGIILEKIEHLQDLSKNIMANAVHAHSINEIGDEELSEACTQSRVYNGQADVLKWAIQSLSESSSV